MKKSKNGYIYYDKHKKTEKEIISNVAWTSVFRWVNALVLIFAIVVVAFFVFFRFVSVSGASMQPTLNDGNVVIYKTYECVPEIGDIVIINSDDESTLVVKRVIATQGQSVEIDYNNKTVTVDGKIISEPYVVDMFKSEKNEITYPYTVPSGHVFVLGDNRIESVDSRNKNIQAVSEESLLGEVVLKVYPFSEIVRFE